MLKNVLTLLVAGITAVHLEQLNADVSFDIAPDATEIATTAPPAALPAAPDATAVLANAPPAAPDAITVSMNAPPAALPAALPADEKSKFVFLTFLSHKMRKEDHDRN